MDNCGLDSPQEAVTDLHSDTNIFSLHELEIRGRARLRLSGRRRSDPVLCFPVAVLKGDRTGWFTVSSKIRAHFSVCGCPICHIEQPFSSIDLVFSIAVDNGGYLKIPQDVTVREGVTLDLCGSLDGVKDGAIGIRDGGTLSASYPAMTGDSGAITGIINMNAIKIFKGGIMKTSTACPNPDNLLLLLDVAILKQSWMSSFIENGFNISSDTSVVIDERRGPLHSHLCPEGTRTFFNITGDDSCPGGLTITFDNENKTAVCDYNNLHMTIGQSCELTPGEHIYQSLILEGGSEINLVGQENGTRLTQLSVSDLTINYGGLIDGKAGGYINGGPGLGTGGTGGSHGGVAGGADTGLTYGSVREPMAYGSSGDRFSWWWTNPDYSDQKVPS